VPEVTLIDSARFAVLDLVEGLDVLDLGCGNGYVARTGQLQIP
jgi:cyclopropane fatty-acyl-phospholipid synthase-like methyltransferase